MGRYEFYRLVRQMKEGTYRRESISVITAESYQEAQKEFDKLPEGYTFCDRIRQGEEGEERDPVSLVGRKSHLALQAAILSEDMALMHCPSEYVARQNSRIAAEYEEEKERLRLFKIQEEQ